MSKRTHDETDTAWKPEKVMTEEEEKKKKKQPKKPLVAEEGEEVLEDEFSEEGEDDVADGFDMTLRSRDASSFFAAATTSDSTSSASSSSSTAAAAAPSHSPKIKPPKTKRVKRGSLASSSIVAPPATVTATTEKSSSPSSSSKETTAIETPSSAVPLIISSSSSSDQLPGVPPEMKLDLSKGPVAEQGEEEEEEKFEKRAGGVARYLARTAFAATVGIGSAMLLPVVSLPLAVLAGTAAVVTAGAADHFLTPRIVTALTHHDADDEHKEQQQVKHSTPVVPTIAK